ncbi:hypothetical protein [Agrococcus sediminis]|uniref:hypothetical protein n=1 Tax=Agrococcus sediminis TaxID=2599924 RepID=UPI0034421E90
MPLLVPLAIALVVAAGAGLLWTWARYVAHRAHGTPVALAVLVLAVAGVALLVLSEAPDASVPAAAGWAALGAAAVVLVAGWALVATVGGELRRGGPARRR